MQKAKRIHFIDIVRAFAILMMLQGHFIDTLLNPNYKNETFSAYNVWLYFRGITAPTFFTISGLVFTYLLLRAYKQKNDKPRIKKGFFRGLLLIFMGYILRVNFISWMFGDFNTNFIVVDVLQCIGLSIIILIGLHLLFRRYTYIYSTILFAIGFLIFLSEPLYRNLSLNSLLPFFANYFTLDYGSVFTMLPWFGYSAFGAFIATVFFRHLHRQKFKLLTVLAFLVMGYLSMYYSSWFLNKVYLITEIDLFYDSANYNYLFTRLGDVLILFGIFYTLEDYLKIPIIVKIGQKTLSVYAFHFILLYGSFTGYGLKYFLEKSLNPTMAVLGALFFMIFVCVLSLNFARTNAFIYSKIKLLIDKIGSK